MNTDIKHLTLNEEQSKATNFNNNSLLHNICKVTVILHYVMYRKYCVPQYHSILRNMDTSDWATVCAFATAANQEFQK